MNQPAFSPSANYTAFAAHQQIASGPFDMVVEAARQAVAAAVPLPVLVFDDATGQYADASDSVREIEARLGIPADSARGSRQPQDSPAEEAPPARSVPTSVDAPRGRGRPRLGVVAREVTLLPRHWDWLAAQPGGASVALRKLVEQARRTHAALDQRRQAQERGYRILAALGGDLAGFEDASRALFADDSQRFSQRVAHWPADVRSYVLARAFADSPSVAPD